MLDTLSPVNPSMSYSKSNRKRYALSPSSVNSPVLSNASPTHPSSCNNSSNVFIFLNLSFFFSLCSASCNRSRFGFYGAGRGRRISHSRCFFLPITLAPARKNLQEIHFKTEGTGAAAYIRTEENPCGDGMEAETWEAQNGIKGTALGGKALKKGWRHDAAVPCAAPGYKRHGGHTPVCRTDCSALLLN